MLGIPYRTVVSCDSKTRAFMLQCRTTDISKQSPEYFFTDMHAFLDVLDGTHRGIKDEISGTIIERNSIKSCMSEQSGRPDFLIAGFPCQPFSQARRGRYSDDGVCAHPSFDASSGIHRALDLLEPSAFLLENVLGMNRPDARADDAGVTGAAQTPLQRFLHTLSSKGRYIYKCYTENLDPWVTSAVRDRCPQPSARARGPES
eukprot:815887-Pyramimonas_sp.AAC.1